MLTPLEFERINVLGIDNGAACFHELLSWAMHAAVTQNREGKLGEIATAGLVGDIKETLMHLQTTFIAYKHPVPFMYQHLLSIINIVFLPLFAYTIAFTVGNGKPANTQTYDEIVGIIVVMFTGIYVLGLRKLGVMLAGESRFHLYPVDSSPSSLLIDVHILLNVQLTNRISY